MVKALISVSQAYIMIYAHQYGDRDAWVFGEDLFVGYMYRKILLSERWGIYKRKSLQMKSFLRLLAEKDQQNLKKINRTICVPYLNFLYSILTSLFITEEDPFRICQVHCKRIMIPVIYGYFLVLPYCFLYYKKRIILLIHRFWKSIIFTVLAEIAWELVCILWFDLSNFFPHLNLTEDHYLHVRCHSS